MNDDFKNKKLLETLVTKRITFNEITSSAIKSAVENPREIDQNLVDAYLTRRILDHLIGFKVSLFFGDMFQGQNRLEEFNLRP